MTWNRMRTNLAVKVAHRSPAYLESSKGEWADRRTPTPTGRDAVRQYGEISREQFRIMLKRDTAIGPFVSIYGCRCRRRQSLNDVVEPGSNTTDASPPVAPESTQYCPADPGRPGTRRL
ncbi:uncharacterized protein LOC134806902 isoform X1 [Cydia splendana]|uniref:uncharacterized protein LOC134795772 n=1 Tax=Cydia splendana TaxID=1100963 RepID=UPI00300C2006